MKQPEKLDSFIIEDSFSLSENELQKRAVEIATDRAAEYGWASFEVSKSKVAPIRKDKFLRHTYEVFGIASEQQGTSSAESEDTSTIHRVAAKSDITI